MTHIRSASRTRGIRHLATVAGSLIIVALVALPLAGSVAGAGSFSGGFAPVAISGQMDLDGDRIVDGSDDSNALFGDTAVIDGRLDCNNWIGANDGTAGDGVIDTNDDCTLLAYDGSVGGKTIYVRDGLVSLPDGQMPLVYPDPSSPNDASYIDANFAWHAINGRVDSNGNGQVNANDCSFGLVGITVDAGLGDATDGYDVLANTKMDSNPCGFGSPHPSWTNNGKVDLNDDHLITAADSCGSCFFGHKVANGLVKAFRASTMYADYTGQLSPSIVAGAADLNGDGNVTGRDDSNAFFGDTAIIDGYLDCNNWVAKNDGTAGDGLIDSNDDCQLLAYDGTADGRTIEVVDGEFQMPNGPMPYVYPDPGTPNDPSPVDANFAWSVIGGRVDSGGNGYISDADCSFGLVGAAVDSGFGDPTDGADVLADDGANGCGFASPPGFVNNGLVDLDSDSAITAADTCWTGCFFGHDVWHGRVLSPRLVLSDVSRAEGDAGHTAFTFTVRLSGPTSNFVTVHFYTANGTASAGSDYLSKTGIITYNVGQTTKPVTVNVVGDTLAETNETFLLKFRNFSNTWKNDPPGIGVILNDD